MNDEGVSPVAASEGDLDLKERSIWLSRGGDYGNE